MLGLFILHLPFISQPFLISIFPKPSLQIHLTEYSVILVLYMQ
jgi:hypothetical protein